ncbi:hypothetical protein [Streptomyces sp. TRM68367]|uniref:hypothetical protein n=1 Tax=Streptomyces sp. TRM68367 TaxID=2758415 RepID=UPI00165AEA1E|nr:hypothetical protein [Streptomyces sp. TRM68367]MBC9730981.1 hypothetical protein [Streptomyces sp. TRM68367]
MLPHPQPGLRRCGEVIQERAAEFGMAEVTHTEAVDLINERLYQRRVRLASGSAADEDLDASVADPGSTAVTPPAA